jgi:hypothetical protein
LFAPQDLQDLRHVVFSVTVTGIEDYAGKLRAAGFTDVAAVAITDIGHRARSPGYRRGATAVPATCGRTEGAYAAEELFYALIIRLYASGSLGGVRVTARPPP